MIELVKVFFKFFLKIKDITTKSTRGINTFPSFDLKLSSLPISDDFFFEISFQLKLFVSRFSDFFNFPAFTLPVLHAPGCKRREFETNAVE